MTCVVSTPMPRAVLAITDSYFVDILNFKYNSEHFFNAKLVLGTSKPWGKSTKILSFDKYDNCN